MFHFADRVRYVEKFEPFSLDDVSKYVDKQVELMGLRKPSAEVYLPLEIARDSQTYGIRISNDFKTRRPSGPFSSNSPGVPPPKAGTELWNHSRSEPPSSAEITLSTKTSPVRRG
jgi:hypothetical protein